MNETHSYTLVLARCGIYRFVGHRDLMRAVTRALRRSGLPFVLTQGFHRIPRLVLPEPLPVGVESQAERWVLFLEEAPSVETVRAALSPEFPAGLDLVGVLLGDHREPRGLVLTLELSGPRIDLVQQAVAAAGTPPEAGISSVELRSSGRASLTADLVPLAGRRPSIGKWLAAVRSQLSADAKIERVVRRVELQSRGPGLESRASLEP